MTIRGALGRVFWSAVRSRLQRGEMTIASTGFYSPLVDVGALRLERERLWPSRPAPCAGIDFNVEGHRALLDGELPRLAAAYDYGDAGALDGELRHFYDGNSQFGSIDARVLFGLLRLWRPQRLVEVGSGYSTLLVADVARRFLDGRTTITAIEPYPRPFLRRLATEGAITLVEQRVQDAGFAAFDTLGAGDVLFVDSSHVAKTGSDVNFLVFEVLPRLRAGVRIHFHDVFLPFEYPEGWVLGDGRSWNEQYVVRALLMYASDTFEVTFSSAFATSQIGPLPAELSGGAGGFGGSLWLTKIA